MVAAEKFASWAVREEITDEHPIKFVRGLGWFERLSLGYTIIYMINT